MMYYSYYYDYDLLRVQEGDVPEEDTLAPKLTAQLTTLRETLSSAYSPGVKYSPPESPGRSAFYMRTLERYNSRLSETRARLASLQARAAVFVLLILSS